MQPKKFEADILCVSATAKGITFIKQLLPDEAVRSLTVAACAADAAQKMRQQKFDICLINAPLPDGSAAALAKQAAGDYDAAVLLFVKSDAYDETAAATEDYGVFVVEKPNSERHFKQALALVFAAKRRTSAEGKKISDLEAKLGEMKIVNRAKLVLIQYLKMDESTAHHYIEKQAMDRRITRREVAESIISTYEYGFEWK